MRREATVVARAPLRQEAAMNGGVTLGGVPTTVAVGDPLRQDATVVDEKGRGGRGGQNVGNYTHPFVKKTPSPSHQQEANVLPSPPRGECRTFRGTKKRANKACPLPCSAEYTYRH